MKNNNSKRKEMLFGLGLLTGVAGGLVAKQQLTPPQRVPHLNRWRPLMVEKFGPAAAARLAKQVRDRYRELYALRPRYTNRVLRQHLEENILPGLALYQVLQAELGSKEKALTEVDYLLQRAFVTPQWKALTWLIGALPRTFSLFRFGVRRMMQLNFPQKGWEIEWKEDNEQCIAFDIHRCFYLNVLTNYGAPELTALYCKGDDVMFDLLPSPVAWERTMTLGRGDALCDFRWTRTVPQTP